MGIVTGTQLMYMYLLGGRRATLAAGWICAKPLWIRVEVTVVTGGVVSGLGKGVTASSLGVLLKAAGYRVTSIKVGARAPAPPPREANCLRTLMETCIRRSTRT